MTSLASHLDLYRGRRVLVTGHTGFKGAWLTFWLNQLGAEVLGLALEPPSCPSLFAEADLGAVIQHRHLDIRQARAVQAVVGDFEPEIIFHLAAQSLVRPSYHQPLETFSVNVMGTATVLEAARLSPQTKAVVVVTSDKCYQNKEWVWGYRENDPMGGHDPYSASKGCAELVTSSYVSSFFPPEKYGREHHTAVASGRAGNVIGGGDWAEDRLVPDCLRAFMLGETVTLRSPGAVRPWQHVLDPLAGYLMLGARLVTEGPQFSGGWNLAPLDRGDTWPVERVVAHLCQLWGGASYQVEPNADLHEAHLLSLDATRAAQLLGWRPRWDVATALAQTVSWYRRWQGDRTPLAVRHLLAEQIKKYME